MAINENLSWAEVGAIGTGGDNHVRDAFKGGYADKVLLPTGFELYKFNEYNSLAPAGAATVSPWWSPFDSYKHDGGWEQRKKLATHLGVSIREFGRVTSAVKENWNSLSYLLVIILGQNTYAYFGGFAQMARIDEGQASKRKTGEARGFTKNLPGGGTQFYIPNLRPQDVSSWRVEPLV
ncbi:MAG TPA: hypothetical protein VGG85_11360 [Terracidiphilus sp.]|jgi:hypothetical protein